MTHPVSSARPTRDAPPRLSASRRPYRCGVFPTPDLAPQVSSDHVRWQIPVALAPDGVRLEVDWVLPADPEFELADRHWTYRLERPAADRFDYRLVLRGSGADGPVLDPTNPRWFPHPFGDRSEIQFPEYVAPAWLGVAAGGRTERLTLTRGDLDRPVPTRLWSPAGLGPREPAPLLVVHDGTDLAENGALLSWAAHRAADRPLRVALLDAPHGYRDRWYAANPSYARHLATIVLPALRDRVAVTAVVGLGASLGGLAMLGLQRGHPSALDGLALQSGTFLAPDLDPQESAFGPFGHVCRAVADYTSQVPMRTVATLMTCGAIEENLANNQRMAEALARQGYPVRWVITPDAHTVIGWRDAWAPHLDVLVAEVAGSAP